MLLYVSLFSFVVDPPRSVFEPRVSRDGGFAAVSVVVEQLLALVDVSGGNEDEVRDAVDVVEFGLAVSVFTVINQPTQAATLFCGVHTVGAKKKKTKCSRQISVLENVNAPERRAEEIKSSAGAARLSLPETDAGFWGEV